MTYDYNKATNDWAALKLKEHHTDYGSNVEVVSVDVGVEYGGYCETCGYEEGAIVAQLNKGKKYEAFLGADVVGMIREVSELISSNPSKYAVE